METNLSQLVIRDARQEDMPVLTRIYNKYVTETTVSFEMEPLTVEEMDRRRQSIVQLHYPYFVAEQGGEIVGYACAHPWKERAAYCHTLETTVYVADEHRHQGIGSILVERLIRDCRQTDARALIACITAENAPSLHLHERMGFQRVSLFREVGRKFGRWLDVIDMELLLRKE